MTKVEIAGYLASLNSLIEAQEKSGTNLRSQLLAQEYEKYWNLLKQIITKENDHETRQSHFFDRGRDQADRG